MTSSVPRLGRRAALVLGAGALCPHRAHAAPIPMTDALGRTTTLKASAERIVLGFNFEESTAVAGPAGWGVVVRRARRAGRAA